MIDIRDLQKPSGKIETGLGFLDHMIDQLNSHAQIGVSLQAGDSKSEESIGRLLGSGLQELTKKVPLGASSTFACPLDEALVECHLQRVDNAASGATVALAPYGKYRRTHIGELPTSLLPSFFQDLATAAGLQITMTKLRGDNAHHIVESAFKALSRGLRNLLDGVSIDEPTLLYGKDTENEKQSIALARAARVSRQTKETSIDAHLQLQPGGAVAIATGIQTLDFFLQLLAEHSDVSLNVSCHGDLWIDEHHTAEDVAIALGQVWHQALGTKAGLNRMWCATAVVGASQVQVVVDLSNRPCLVHDLALVQEGVEKVGDLSLEMFEHVLDSLVVNARWTVHIVQVQASENLMETIEATAIAFGKALRYCAMVDSRRMGATASSKGTLSV